MDEWKVKGTMLIDQVKMIRVAKSLDWSKYLEPEDWEVINSRILPSEWYPVELYKRIGWATFQVIAQGDLDLVRSRGRFRGKELFENVYKTVVIARDPTGSVERFVVLYSQFFTFKSLTFEGAGKDHCRVHHFYHWKDSMASLYCHILLGHFDVLIEMAGGKNVKLELATKQWEGTPHTTFDMTWK
jgi:hypothetical protein